MGTPSSMRLIGPDSMNPQEEVSLNVAVECAAVARAACRQFSRLVIGIPQFTTMRLGLHESSKDRQPAWASRLTGRGGNRPVSIRMRVPVLSSLWYPEWGALASGDPRASS